MKKKSDLYVHEDHKRSSFWFGFALGVSTASSAIFFLGTKKGRETLKRVLELSEGLDDVLNVSLNRATINGLVDSFGEDSKDWQNNYLTAETEKVRVAGVARVALYLVPEGYEKQDDENGYAVIVKKGTNSEIVKDENIPVINPEEEGEVNLKDIPF